MNQSISYKTKISLLFALILLFVMAVAIVAADSNELVVNEPTAQIAQINKSEEFVDYELAYGQESASIALVSAKTSATFDLSEKPVKLKPIIDDGGVAACGYGWSD